MSAPDHPIEEGDCELADGRVLRWAQWGAPGGEPVMLFHGNPGSRLFRLDEHALETANVRLITVDRPGCGGSSPRPGRRMRDWADDIAQLADALSLDRLSIVSISMGGPHALACGARLADRVAAIAVHASPGPWSEPEFEALAPPQIREMRNAFADNAEAAEQRYRQAFEAQRRMMLDQPEQALDAFVARLPEPDRKLMADTDARRMALADATEAVRAGSEGFFEERKAGYVLDWGFRLADVAVPVTVFHGTEDVWVPPSVGIAIAQRLPDARLRLIDGIGHFPPWSLHRELLGAAVGERTRP